MFSLEIPISSEGGHTSFQNNVPDPVTSGKELPTFKFELEKSEGRVLGGSYGKEATVEQLPISKGIAGVSMRMEPGVMRELHWHATAAEWAFVTEGAVRTTVIDPQGCSETNDFRAGRHLVLPARPRPCHRDARATSRAISSWSSTTDTSPSSAPSASRDWIGHAPKELLAKNFGLPASTFDSFPKNEVYFAKGKIPPAVAAPPAARLEDGLRSRTSTVCFRRSRSRSSAAAWSGEWMALSFPSPRP